MSQHMFAPSRWLLVGWILFAGLAAFAIGKAAAGFCLVLSYSPTRGFALAFGLTWGLFALFAIAYYLSLRYVLDDHYITKTSGVFWRHRRSILLDKITNIDVRQGPVEQLLHLGQVCIYTPTSGGETPEARLPGVRQPQALRDAIVQRAEAELPAAATDVTDERREVVQLLGEIRDRLAQIETHLQAAAESARAAASGTGAKGAAGAPPGNA